jgi:CheY-like chemotaxis protein
VLANFTELLKRTIRENIHIEQKLSNTLPPIKADPGQIEQVIMNLALNAQDAMPDGGTLTLETGTARLDEAYAERYEEVTPGFYVLLAVSDTGFGMDAETAALVFEPFFTTKEFGQGAGLGMSTVFGIVKQHQGHISCYSEPGEGTTFKVYLPIAETEADQPAPKSEAKDRPRGHETVLITEDDPLVLNLARDVLVMHGYSVLAANSAEEACKIATDHKPIDLLLSDVIMPGMSGRELYEALLTHHPNLKVLYMSGYTRNVIAHHGIMDKGIQFLQKPFTGSALTQQVRGTLDQ